MIITPSSLNVFFTSLSTQFSELFQSTPTWWSNIATLWPSTTETETIGWMGRVPTFREWVGPRVAHGIATEGYVVRHKPYELTIEVDKFKLQDDQYGLYSPIVRQMAIQAKKWPDYLMVDALQLGGSATLGLCPDGLSFWNDSHPNDVYNSGAGTFDNNYALNLTPDNYQTIRAEMMTRVGQDGKPLGVVPNELWVPPALEAVGKQILEASYFANLTMLGSTQAGTSENVWKGTATLRVVPELGGGSNDVGTNDKTWYLIDTTKALKPLLFVQRAAPTFTYRFDPTDPVVFDSHTFLFGGEARGTYAYALPFLASRSVGS